MVARKSKWVSIRRRSETIAEKNCRSASRRQRTKWSDEIVFGWYVVEWKLALPAPFQWSYKAAWAVNAANGTSRFTNDSSKTTMPGERLARAVERPSRIDARASRVTQAITI